MRRLSSDRSNRPCKALSFSGNGAFLAVCRDWSPGALASDGKMQRSSEISIYQHSYVDEMMEAMCMSLHPRLGDSSPAQVLDGSAELLRKIWETAKMSELEKKATQYGHAGRINSVAWGKEDRVIATGGEDGIVIVWAIECAAPCDGGLMLDEAMRLVGHDASVTTVAFTRSGNCMASSSCDLTIRLWDPVLGGVVGILAGHTDFVSDLAFSRDGAFLATAGRDQRSVRLWGVHSGQEKERPQFQGLPKGSARSVAFSNDGRLLAMGCSDWMVRVYDVKTGLPPKWGGVLSAHWGIVTCLAFCEIGGGGGECLVSGSDDGSVRVWDVETGRQIGDALQHGCIVGCLDTSGHHLATCSGDVWTVYGEVCVWDLGRRRGGGECAGIEGWTGEILGGTSSTVVDILSRRQRDGCGKMNIRLGSLGMYRESDKEKEENQKRLLQDDVRAYYVWMHRSGGGLPAQVDVP